MFIHVLEGREPENRETKVTTHSPSLSLFAMSSSLQRMAGVSPKKAAGRDSSPVRSSPAKPKVIIENLQRPPLIPRDGLGQFASSQPHLKILDTCRSAYTNYQVILCASMNVLTQFVGKSNHLQCSRGLYTVYHCSLLMKVILRRCLWQELEKTSFLVFFSPLTTWPPSSLRYVQSSLSFYSHLCCMYIGGTGC